MMVVAAFTLTCWPTMARTTSSKPDHAPGTRKPGAASIERCQPWIGGKMRANCLRVRVQVEHSRDGAASASACRLAVAFDGRDDAALARVRADRQRAAVAAPVDGAAIGAIFHRLDAGRGASCEETQDARPVEGRFEGQFERSEVGGACSRSVIQFG